MQIVCDTNVLISAVVYGGRPREILEALIAGRTKGFISPAMEQEFREVLSRPKFGLSQIQIRHICQALGDLLHFVYPERTVSVIEDDPADDAVLACALAARAGFIISGDAHLLRLGSFQGIPILRPADFLAIVAY